MSARAFPSSPITSASLTRNKHTVSIIACTLPSGNIALHGVPICSTQVRMFWGRGWKSSLYNNRHSCHGRVNRQEVLHDMARNCREQYLVLNRMSSRSPVYRRFWKNWGDSEKQSHRPLRSGHRNDGSGSDNRRGYWHDDINELVKKIEADPYNFLFGRSNQYLQLPRSWSSFCHSFLNPESSLEQQRVKKTAPLKKQSKENGSTSSVKQGTAFAQAESEDVASKSNTTSDPDEHLHFDPISGRMRPTEQSTTQVKQVNAKSELDNSRETSAHTAPLDKSHVSNSSVLYMGSPTKNVSVTPEDQTKSIMDAAKEQEIAPHVTLDQHQGQKQKTIYDLDEVKEDDVDLLRASDIRASFFAGQTMQEVAEKKKATREALEKDYSSSSDQQMDINNEIIQDLKLKKDLFTQGAGHTEAVPTDLGAATDSLKAFPGATNTSPSKNSDAVYEEEYTDATQDPWQNDAAIFYETIPLETTPIAGQSKPTTTTLNSSLTEAVASAKQFIDIIRLLTQDIMDTCERLEASTATDTFRILAYDSASAQIVFAETTSSLHTIGEIHHPAEVLLHINHPAKFLPHFARMKADGYEIVSGGGDILIFRKAGNTSLQDNAAKMGTTKFDDLPVIGSVKSSSINDALSKESSSPQSASQPKPAKSRIVQRQETVYTGGPPNWSPYPPTTAPSLSDMEPQIGGSEEHTETNKSSFSKIGRGIRRVILSGFAMAGTFYAIGVVCEYFITGGQDGLGPEGFTEFEAERRRRE